jgi:hypothetical protein
MGGWIAAAGGGSQVDGIARWIAAVGLIVAIAGIAVQLYLWHRSGTEVAVLMRYPSQGTHWGKALTSSIPGECRS